MFKRGLSTAIPTGDIVEGAFYLTIDTGELYYGKDTTTLLKITDPDISPAAPIGILTLTATDWILDSTLGLYKQTATIPGLTAQHKVDLDADYNTISVLNDNIVPYNENGTFYAVTKTPPGVDIAIQYSLILTK